MTNVNRRRLEKAPDFLSVADAASILRLSARHLRRLIACDRSPVRFKRLSPRLVVIPRAALAELAQA